MRNLSLSLSFLLLSFFHSFSRLFCALDKELIFICPRTLQDATQTCNREDCQALLKESCTVVHPCGHLCGGIVGEEEHLPCLRCSKDLLVVSGRAFLLTSVSSSSSSSYSSSSSRARFPLLSHFSCTHTHTQTHTHTGCRRLLCHLLLREVGECPHSSTCFMWALLPCPVRSIYAQCQVARCA